jgi:hypothetical protein
MISALVALTALFGTLAQSGGVATADSGGANYQPLPASIRHEIRAVPLPVLRAVGKGHETSVPGLVNQKLRKSGLPEVAYILGEFCPYCAAESWIASVALSRFGQFHNLTTLTSASHEGSMASLQTVSFRYSRYTSRYLVFVPIVNEDTNHNRVEPVPAGLRKVWKHDDSGFGYPFVDFGGRAVQTVSPVNPRVLHGLSRAQIAAELSKPGSAVARAIDGGANEFTAAVCVATKNKPAKVCAHKPVKSLERALKPRRR